MDESKLMTQEYGYSVRRVIDNCLHDDCSFINCQIPMTWYDEEKDLICSAGHVEVTAVVTDVYKKKDEGLFFKLAILNTDANEFIPLYSHLVVEEDVIDNGSIIENIPEREDVYESYAESYEICKQLQESSALAVHGVLYGPKNSITNVFPKLAECDWLLEDKTLKDGTPVKTEGDAEKWLLENHPDFYTDALVYRVFPNTSMVFPSDVIFKTDVYDCESLLEFSDTVDLRRDVARTKAYEKAIVIGEMEAEKYEEFLGVLNEEAWMQDENMYNEQVDNDNDNEQYKMREYDRQNKDKEQSKMDDYERQRMMRRAARARSVESELERN